MTEISSSAATAADERPGTIDAVPVRHLGRWVAVAVIALGVAVLVHFMLTNDAFHWSFVWEAMVQTPVINGLLQGTLLGTAGSMVIGVVLGVVVAVMRLSENPVLSWTAWAYTWFF